MHIKMGIKELVEFVLKSGDIDNRFTGSDRALLGSKIHRKLQKQGGAGYIAEQSLNLEIYEGDIQYSLHGRADGIITDGESVTIDEIKTVSTPLDIIDENFYPAHWGQGCFYRYIVAKEKEIDIINVRLTYYNIDTDEIKRIVKKYTKNELADFVLSVLKKYRKWAVFESEWRDKRNSDMKKLVFPFSDYREGQRNVSRAVFRTQRDKKRLFVNAPTGIGKTMSVMFPSLKSMGEQNADKIFYLTAKTVTSQRALNACQIIYSQNENVNLKTLLITAKDKMCANDKRECNPVSCPFARGYFDRVNDVVYDCISHKNLFSAEKLRKTATENMLCPYELTLDLSLWCDVIICDYNYLFDPVVKLQRYFSVKNEGYTFLIDESHNLPDRVREMYSAVLSKKAVLAVKSKIPKQNKKLVSALNKLNTQLLQYRKKLEVDETNHSVSLESPKDLYGTVDNIIRVCTDYFDKHKGEETDNDLLNLFFDARFFQKILDEYDENYVTIIERQYDELQVKLFCADPCNRIDENLSLGDSAVMFSATLSPENFYKEQMGNAGDILCVRSPFSQDNLGLYMIDSVSTKYTDREKTIDKLCEIIHAVFSSKNGNYIVYFPSYAYLNMVRARYNELYYYEILIQNQSMSDSERAEFLNEFNNGNAILAFCVMGGIYGEGIDLTGDRLIGSIIVGVGLPQINVSLDCIKEHYNSQDKDGFAYAYQYPGMNKVLQARGRVIRTETDRGIVVLIDSRFSQPKYLKTMPQHWNHIKRINNTEILRDELDKFWNNN